MAELKTTEAKRKANAKYDAGNTRQYHLKLNMNTDSDIIRKFDQVSSIQGYIKMLIRKDIQSEG